MMLYKLYEAADEVIEVVEETSNTFTLTPQQVKIGILILVVIGLAIYFIVRPTEEKTNEATKFLNSLATQIMSIIFANIEYKINTYDGTIDLSFDEFKEKLLDTIYDESWSFVEKSVKDAVEKQKINPIAAKYIKRESVESLVNVVIGRENVQQKLVDAFNLLFDKYNEQMIKEEEEDAAFAAACENEPEDEPEIVKDEAVEAFTGNSEADEPSEEIQESIEEPIVVLDETTIPEDNDPNAVG